MADMWDNNNPSGGQVQDDEEIPDNWDDEPQEKVCELSPSFQTYSY